MQEIVRIIHFSKITISTDLIKVLGFCYSSGMPSFKYRFSWNYNASPFNLSTNVLFWNSQFPRQLSIVNKHMASLMHFYFRIHFTILSWKYNFFSLIYLILNKFWRWKIRYMQYSVTNRETFSYIGYNIHTGYSRLLTENTTYIQDTVGYLQRIQHTYRRQ